MMFVSGGAGDPSTETTWMIEEIVRQQVVEIVRLVSILEHHLIDTAFSVQ